MSDVLVDVLHERNRVRQEVPDLGPGWWLAAMSGRFRSATRLLARGRHAREQAREELQRLAALSLLLIESFEREDLERQRRADDFPKLPAEGQEDIEPADRASSQYLSSLSGRPVAPEQTAQAGGPFASSAPSVHPSSRGVAS